MAGTTTVRRAVRLALVSAGVVGALALSGSAAFADGTPSVAPSAVASGPAVSAPAGSGVKPSVAPTTPAKGDAQVKVTPKGGAQTGEADSGSSTGTLVIGSGLAAVGAAGIGFAIVRRRAGAQG
ncbi:hypothetical protein F4556_005246 [Kitasatospora gansuensis]|uniref:Tat pathway signal sequence domain protein n=1 Tax=Kitasatospora gansuensis TaxID=258050 RepID=A0A7W7WJV8_9ACTN|nr:hypothetical protein [Kitasatospora gansuensis]MBB4949711.1 hypothetical protein [Kitasatospora gansuensis]